MMDNKKIGGGKSFHNGCVQMLSYVKVVKHTKWLSIWFDHVMKEQAVSSYFVGQNILLM